MKTLFSSALLCLAVSAFAQETKKDEGSIYDYGTRIYDTRTSRSMSVDPKASQQNSPYKFAENKPVVIDTTATKQPDTEPKKKIITTK